MVHAEEAFRDEATAASTGGVAVHMHRTRFLDRRVVAQLSRLDAAQELLFGLCMSRHVREGECVVEEDSRRSMSPSTMKLYIDWQRAYAPPVRLSLP